MPKASPHDESHARIELGLLELIERDGAQSQRKLAASLGIALGLVNAYLKRCVTKGLLKISEAPTRRYAYYLTPKGFSEKSRLTVDYLASSFSFFRRARADCAEAVGRARANGWRQIGLLGVSDLAEIAVLCALESDVTIVAIIDPAAQADRFAGVPVYRSFDELTAKVDAVLVTDLQNAHETATLAAGTIGASRVLVPALLGVRLRDVEARHEH